MGPKKRIKLSINVVRNRIKKIIDDEESEADEGDPINLAKFIIAFLNVTSINTWFKYKFGFIILAKNFGLEVHLPNPMKEENKDDVPVGETAIKRLVEQLTKDWLINCTNSVVELDNYDKFPLPFH